MGEAIDRHGDVLGSATGHTRSEVLGKLEQSHPDAAEYRIKGAAPHNAGEAAAGNTARDPMVGGAQQSRPPISERLTMVNVEEAFTYQPWNDIQQAQGQAVRNALVEAARTILAAVPESPLRTRALNNLIDARMLANAAITFRGRF